MTVRIGVIGTGAIGRDHARRINKVLGGAKVVALSDVNHGSAEAVRNDIAPDAEIFATGEEPDRLTRCGCRARHLLGRDA